MRTPCFLCIFIPLGVLDNSSEIIFQPQRTNLNRNRRIVERGVFYAVLVVANSM